MVDFLLSCKRIFAVVKELQEAAVALESEAANGDNPPNPPGNAVGTPAGGVGRSGALTGPPPGGAGGVPAASASQRLIEELENGYQKLVRNMLPFVQDVCDPELF